MVANLSGMLINTDMVLDYPRPQPPTFLNIGGIQVARGPSLHVMLFWEYNKYLNELYCGKNTFRCVLIQVPCLKTLEPS